ncbi:MAG: glycosyl transferase family 1 [Proteobacteria bacterium]|nr:MAG: glycosyl transferase family 1 [Pseudomonadota bacterium]
MKVLHVYRTSYPDTRGGLEEVIRQICSGTFRLGVENRVFSFTTSRDPWVINLPHSRVYRVQQHLEVASCNMAFRGWSLFRSLVAWADIIHYHFPWPFADVMHLVNRVQKPSLVTYHSDIIRQKQLLGLYRPLMHRFLGKVDQIVATSPNYVESSPVLKKFRFKTTVIPIGLDEAGYPEVREEWLNRQEKESGRDFFLFVGVLRYYKGLHILLQALSLLDRKQAEIRMVIAGAGPEEANLKQQAKKLGLHNVTFLGFVSDEVKAALFRLCRAVVFPSHLRSEAFGVTLLEASMHGKPMITAEIGTGTSFVNKKNETGLVVSPGDPHILADAIQSLASDRHLATRLGEQARRRYQEYFTGETMCRSYEQLYRKLYHDRKLHQGLP